MVLFPYILRMEEAVVAKEPVLPPPFGSVRNPITMMMARTRRAGGALRSMHAIGHGYAAPPMPASASRRCTRRWRLSKPIAPAHPSGKQRSLPARDRHGAGVVRGWLLAGALWRRGSKKGIRHEL